MVYLALGILKESGFTEYVQLISTQKIYRGVVIILYMNILFYSLQSLYPFGSHLDLNKDLYEVVTGQEFKRGQHY